MRDAVSMLVQAFISLRRLAILVALAVSLTATGFAHRAPAAQDQALALAYAMGAGLEDFCGDGPDGHPRGADCLACQITGTADLPVVANLLIAADLAFVARVVASQESRALIRARDPAHSPQGPPTA